MGSSRNPSSQGTMTDDPGRVSDLASRALGMLAARRIGADRARHWISRLHDAVISPDPAARDVVLRAMLDEGIGRETVCDVFVPAVARRLGDEWCADEMSFADVTIGSARLQALLRDVALRTDHDPADGGAELMVMVVADEYHTLGAMVLTGQLRRMGASVRLVLGRPEAEVRKIVAEGSFDAILLSVALADDFPETRRMIGMLRDVTEGQVPLVVGGSILELGPEAARDATGADHVTNDPREALGLSGHDITSGPST